MTVQQHHPQLVPTDPPAQPASAVPSDPPKPATPRRKPPAWWAKPEAIAAFVLVLALVEMIAFGVLDWMWWLIAHAALAALLFVAALAWRRKGRGGPLNRLLSGWGGTSRRRGNSGTGIGLRSAGFLGRSRGGTSTGGASGPSGGGRQLFGRRKPATSAGRMGGASAGTVRKPGGLLGRNRAASPSGTTGGGGRTERSVRKTPWWRSGKTNTPDSGGVAITPDTKPASGGKKPSPKPAHQTAGDNDKSTDGKPNQASERPQPNQAPANGQNNTRGNSMTNNSGGMQYSADQSLQRAGANLAAAEAAAAEIQRLYAQAESAKAKFNEIFGRATDQMENDLPASARLKGEMESTRHQAQHAASADEWRAVTAQAATLPATYRREHEVDEERLAGGRGGRHKEKRADVTAAEQDN